VHPEQAAVHARLMAARFLLAYGIAIFPCIIGAKSPDAIILLCG